MSYQINVADCAGLPSPDEVLTRMQEYGAPEQEEYRILYATQVEAVLSARVARMIRRAVTILNEDTHKFEETSLLLARQIDLRLTAAGQLVTTTGGLVSLADAEILLGSCLGLPTIVERWTLDLQTVVEHMLRDTARCQLRTVNVGEYSHNSYMTGPYRPRFLDSIHGREFLEEYGEAAKDVRLRWQSGMGRASATIRPNGCVTYSCQADDQPHVERMLLDVLARSRGTR
jgi:hypothetical protein